MHVFCMFYLHVSLGIWLFFFKWEIWITIWIWNGINLVTIRIDPQFRIEYNKHLWTIDQSTRLISVSIASQVGFFNLNKQICIKIFVMIYMIFYKMIILTLMNDFLWIYCSKDFPIWTDNIFSKLWKRSTFNTHKFRIPPGVFACVYFELVGFFNARWFG